MKKDFWERFAFAYDTAMKKGDRADREAARYIAGFLPSNCRLLEAACGTGRFSCALSPFVKQISCCDYAENMVRQTEKKAARLGLHNLDFSVQDITALTFPDHHFDVAMAANVLHLLPHPEKALAELMRVLRPGGLLVIPNFVNGESNRSGRRFLRMIGTLGFQPKNEWTTEQFLTFLKSHRLEIIQHRVFASKQPLCVAIAKTVKYHR